MSADHDQPYYTVAEAARRLQVSPSTVWRWIDGQKLPAYRVGGRAIRIRKADLETVIQPAKAVRPVRAREQTPPTERVDIWATYDVERVRRALQVSAGAFRGVDTERLKADIAADREQDSPGRPA